MRLLVEKRRVGRGGETKERTELVLFEENLVHGVLNGAEVVDGFADDERVGLRLEGHDGLAQNVVPNLSLGVPVHQMASLERQHVVEPRQVLALLQLVSNKVLTSLSLGPVHKITIYDLQISP